MQSGALLELPYNETQISAKTRVCRNYDNKNIIVYDENLATKQRGPAIGCGNRG